MSNPQKPTDDVESNMAVDQETPIFLLAGYIGLANISRAAISIGEAFCNVGHGNESALGEILIKCGICGHAVSVIIAVACVKSVWQRKNRRSAIILLGVAFLIAMLADARIVLTR